MSHFEFKDSVQYEFSYKGPFANGVTKVNMETGETLAWHGDEYCHPSEAVFVPRIGAEIKGSVIFKVPCF